MNIDLSTLSRSELVVLQEDVSKALAEAEARDRQAALDAARAAASEFGFSLDEISGNSRRRGGRPNGSLSPPRYANPADQEQTWTGKGRKPNWFTEALSRGINPSEMEL